MFIARLVHNADDGQIPNTNHPFVDEKVHNLSLRAERIVAFSNVPDACNSRRC